MDLPDGSRKQCRVLSLGLARSFALEPDEKRAAIGSLTGDEWTWQWQEGLAPAVEKAIASHRKERSATFVDLPLSAGSEDR